MFEIPLCLFITDSLLVYMWWINLKRSFRIFREPENHLAVMNQVRFFRNFLTSRFPSRIWTWDMNLTFDKIKSHFVFEYFIMDSMYKSLNFALERGLTRQITPYSSKIGQSIRSFDSSGTLCNIFDISMRRILNPVFGCWKFRISKSGHLSSTDSGCQSLRSHPSHHFEISSWRFENEQN